MLAIIIQLVSYLPLYIKRACNENKPLHALLIAKLQEK